MALAQIFSYFHLISGVNDNDIICHHCNKRFSNRGNLNQHNRAVHRKVKPFQCPWCKQSYSQRITLKVHMERAQKSGTCFIKK